MHFTEHLKKNRDFRNVYQNGKSFGCRTLVMYVLKNGTQTNRLGISVSKKVGNSVVRHRLTRLIRESYRLNEDRFVEGLDMVVIARPGAKEVLKGSTYFDIESALLYLGKRQKILREAKKIANVEETVD